MSIYAAMRDVDSQFDSVFINGVEHEDVSGYHITYLQIVDMAYPDLVVPVEMDVIVAASPEDWRDEERIDLNGRTVKFDGMKITCKPKA